MKLISKFFVSVVTILTLSQAAMAYPAQFVGTWRNTNPHANGIIRLVIRPGMTIQAYGRCTPTPCDFGVTPFYTYGNSISDMNHRYGTALYNFSFKQATLVARLNSSRSLTLEDFNRFTDASGRQNYRQRNHFRKVSTDVEGEFPSLLQEPEN